MATRIENNANGTISVTVTFKPGATMLESETNLQEALNEAGARATGECLERFDLDGAKMTVAGRGMTSKGRMPKIYQTPYGETSVKRHVYQGSKGGAVFCPMEHAARTMRTATPMFAKQVSFKYANANAGTVVMDFAQHGRAIARSYVGEVASDVASVAAEKEENWSYAVPVAPAGERVATVGIGVDGTCTLFSEEGWRQVMVGTIAFYDGKGERLATTYVADAPEYGKATFFARMDAEIACVREAYPDAAYVGVADGAHDLWAWLEGRCDWQVVDFWHASEYLAAAAAGMRRGASAQTAWLEDACHRLKHEKGAAAALLAEFREAREQLGDRARGAEALDKAISYFGNHLERMKYDVYAAMNMPIGSGVTEAACKCIAKERLCGSGMRWSIGGAAGVLSLRTLVKSSDRWEEFWKKTARFGFSRICAPKRPCRA